jgi:hypothetical protein
MPQKLGLAHRKELFAALVEAQDHGVDVDESRRRIATRFNVPEQLVREIELEGERKDWPPL